VYTLLITGDTPGASTYFNPLLQQSIVPCTSGTRPSSPPEGMTVYETDTDRYSSWNGSAWLTLGQTVTSAFTPVLTATTTNPTLGSGSVVAGRYTLWGGKFCTYMGMITFGTSGVGAGSGQYLISLPVAAVGAGGGIPGIISGSAIVRDNSAVDIRNGNSFLIPGATTLSLIGGDAIVTNAVPWIWAASDYMNWNITYETA
jgi:hypothetical protein